MEKCNMHCITNTKGYEVQNKMGYTRMHLHAWLQDVIQQNRHTKLHGLHIHNYITTLYTGK